jgi:FolB domain-containing protein
LKPGINIVSYKDKISINNLEIDCIIGIYPEERIKTQLLIIDIDMFLDTSEAGKKESLLDSVDYSAIAAQVDFIVKKCQFGLLETAAHILATYLLAPPASGEQRAAVSEVSIKLKKPNALSFYKSMPSIEIHRDSSWVSIGKEFKPFGDVDVICETKENGIYRLNIAPGCKIPLHIHQKMSESEMVLGDGLLCQDKAATRGSIRHWPFNVPHVYENPTERYQTILCIDSPPFIPTDEIEVSDASGER